MLLARAAVSHSLILSSFLFSFMSSSVTLWVPVALNNSSFYFNLINNVHPMIEKVHYQFSSKCSSGLFQLCFLWFKKNQLFGHHQGFISFQTRKTILLFLLVLLRTVTNILQPTVRALMPESSHAWQDPPLTSILFSIVVAFFFFFFWPWPFLGNIHIWFFFQFSSQMEIL